MKRLSGDVGHPREGKAVYIGSTWKDILMEDESGAKRTVTLRAVHEIIERAIGKYGQYLLSPDIEVNMFWTNLSFSIRNVIAPYRAHGNRNSSTAN